MFLSFFRIYSVILPQRHKDTKIIGLLFIIAFLMRGTLKLVKNSGIQFIFITSLGPRLPDGGQVCAPGPDLACNA
jgi:hypothetical protein